MTLTISAILNNINTGLVKFQEQAYLAAKTVQGDYIERVFDEGKDSKGQTIKKYSTTAGYFSGSRNKSQSGYYEGGYAEFKKRINKTKAAQSGNWDLTLTGETRFANSGELTKAGDFTWELKVGGDAAEKMGWLTENSDKVIFQATEQELETWNGYIIDSLNDLLNGR